MPALRILDCLSEPGSADHPNEDIAGHGLRSAWVLDGATGLADRCLLPGNSDAAWLARQYDAMLRERADDAEQRPRRLLADLIAAVARRFEAESRPYKHRFELPSAGMVLVRLRKGLLEYARLGDCHAIFRLPGGAVVSTRRPVLLNRLDATVVRKMQALRERGEVDSFDEARKAVQGDLRANRARLNRPFGYWVLGTEPRAVWRMEVGTLALPEGGRITGLLVTDGFYRLVDTIGVIKDGGDLLERALETGLRPMLAELRGQEDEDEECTAHPRLKRKDDATALLFEAAAR
jgi:hypothetical protein